MRKRALDFWLILAWLFALTSVLRCLSPWLNNDFLLAVAADVYFAAGATKAVTAAA